ncbi:6-phosphofructokinase [Niallia circulans]|uniref:6-phosphofructokinase n=2 Tax=Bacillaceae TaxID=186817 RepID=A0A268S4N8_SHOCL|nr:6-phosphofructokinase [Shouchella clausii]PAD43355.1 hypothetical protein CHH54_07350 [Bacillus sp. 7520-S]SPT78581.1 6-phosphofructokinase [Niallia circulans]MBU8596779.1 6-phosphofructokinase [Shouchella clausii]MCM3551005.1 6-phosphofructokinase [Shouchella clausii]MCY1104177.1 6-phosphofructokinase [Shouchella clausii]
MSTARNIALITSGGDAPGLNGAIAAIAQTPGVNLYFYHGGFDGIIEQDPVAISPMTAREAVLQGELLCHSGRSTYMLHEAGQKRVLEKLKQDCMDALIVCGGNGSAQGAKALSASLPVAVVPMTIDNDIGGSEYTIGHDTAVNAIADSLHRLRQTAANLPGRIFMVETFGGRCGQLPLAAAVAASADIVLLPEYELNIDEFITEVQARSARGKSVIIVVSEGVYLNKRFSAGDQGVSFALARALEDSTGKRVRLSILGYTQRAGDPTSYDCLMAKQMGKCAVDALLNGEKATLAALKEGHVKAVPLTAIDQPPTLAKEFMKLAFNENQLIQLEG